MKAKLELYRVFKTVSEEESFSGAAKKLFLTQSAVSQSIMQLEESLNSKLFIRTSKGVKLTIAGEKLYGFVASALGLLKTGEEKLLKEHELLEGELLISSGDTLAKYFLLPHISRFHQLYPGVNIRVVNRTSGESVEMLKSGRAELAIVNLPLKKGEVEVLSSFHIEDIFVAGKEFEHLKDEEFTLKEVSKLPLIMLERAANSRLRLDDFFLSKGIRLSPEFELGAYDLLLEFAKIGLGAATVVREFLGNGLNEGLFELKLKEPLPKREVGVIKLYGIPLSSAAQRFLGLITDESQLTDD